MRAKRSSPRQREQTSHTQYLSETDRLRAILQAPASRRSYSQSSESQSSGSRHSVSRPAASRQRERVGPETEVIKVAVHRPQLVADRLHEVLFSDEVHLSAFR